MFPDVFLAFLGKPLAELLGIDPNDSANFDWGMLFSWARKRIRSNSCIAQESPFSSNLGE